MRDLAEHITGVGLANRDHSLGWRRCYVAPLFGRLPATGYRGLVCRLYMQGCWKHPAAQWAKQFQKPGVNCGFIRRPGIGFETVRS